MGSKAKTSKKAKFATLSQIAAMVGKNPSIISRSIARDNVKPVKGRLYLVADVLASLRKSSERDTRPLGDADTPKNRKLIIEAQILQRKLDEIDGKLADKQELDAAYDQVSLAVKSDFLSLPAALAPLVANRPAPACAKIIRDAVTDCLRHLSERSK
jgi:hypothetical protein